MPPLLESSKNTKGGNDCQRKGTPHRIHEIIKILLSNASEISLPYTSFSFSFLKNNLRIRSPRQRKSTCLYQLI